MIRRAMLLSGLALLLLSRGWGQKTAPPVLTGTVTGHVIFAETRQPARLVEVTLARRPTMGEANVDAKDEMPVKMTPRVVALSGRTGLDGSFSIPGVPVGEYYALAKLTGYVLPLAPITTEKQAADVDTVMRDVPRVTVTANVTAQVDLALHRGGVISGRVQFEDGSPVITAFINLEPADAEDRFLTVRPYSLQQALQMESDRNVTDDEGRFRIAGLRPGKYKLVTEVIIRGGQRLVSDGRSVNFAASKQGRFMIPIYAPAAFRKKEAQVFEIQGSEQITDALIEVRLSGLHAVTGRVLAKEDRHAPNQAYVSLTDMMDKTFNRGARLEEDGTFQIGQVPAGTYTLKVSARDVAETDPRDLQAEPTVLRSFDETKMEVVVTEDAIVPEILLKEKVKTK